MRKYISNLIIFSVIIFGVSCEDTILEDVTLKETNVSIEINDTNDKISSSKDWEKAEPDSDDEYLNLMILWAIDQIPNHWQVTASEATNVHCYEGDYGMITMYIDHWPAANGHDDSIKIHLYTIPAGIMLPGLVYPETEIIARRFALARMYNL